MRATRIIAIALLVAVIAQSALFAVDGKKTEYIGGTVAGVSRSAWPYG